MHQNDLVTTASRAVLASIQLPGVSDAEHEASLDELERLCTTLGFTVIGRLSQKRSKPATGTLLGEGKLRELASWTGGSGQVERYRKPGSEGPDDTDTEALPIGEAPLAAEEKATLVVFDCEMTPTQLRNLEAATGVEVLDRSGVILEIFSRHARSREARLQVEIAKLAYMAPRLRASRVGGDRQGGGIGAKGAGETAHELDRRRIRDRIAELKQQLDAIGNDQNVRRAQRHEAHCVALVGYTNAGTSSLMRALTRTEVLVENKLFATLDTTVRTLQPETVPKVLVSDTVGFIKKLPHDLVASFRSTLDEARAASLLLFVVDAADPQFRSQLEVTQTVLADLGIESAERLLILNKSDLLSAELRENLATEFPKGVFVCSKEPASITYLHQLILSCFEKQMRDEVRLIPYEHSRILAQLRERARIIDERHEEEGTYVTVRASTEVLAWLDKALSSV